MLYIAITGVGGGGMKMYNTGVQDKVFNFSVMRFHAVASIKEPSRAPVKQGDGGILGLWSSGH